MRVFYYIELFFITLVISCVIIGCPNIGLVIAILGCLWILYVCGIFIDIKNGDIIYRPSSLLFEAYGDPDGRTYYEVLEKHKTSAIVKNLHDGSIRKLYLTEYIIFSYKILNKHTI